MAQPLSLCIEDVNAPPSRRYVRCVALPGRRPGLRLSSQGQVLWLTETDVAGELCVSASGHLVLFRPPGPIQLVVKRGSHAALVPMGRAVTLLDQDVVSVGNQILRIHIHGVTSSIMAPVAFAISHRPPAPLERWEAAQGTRSLVPSSPGRHAERDPSEIDPPSTMKPIEPLPQGTNAAAPEAETGARSAEGLGSEADGRR